MAERPRIELGETDLAVPTLAAPGAVQPTVLCTIAFHPEVRRIGEELQLGSGRSWRVRISRLEGEFRRRLESEEPAAPLGVGQVSRDPLEIRRQGETLVFARSGRAPVSIGGEPLVTELGVDSARLQEGLTIELGPGVVLFMHESPRRSAPHADDLGMVGDSDAIAHVREQVKRVADLNVPVLVRGETGSGKELVARALHRLSGRPGAFVGVNMAAVPETTAAAELFGHVRGAFTDAKADGKGYFQAADGGTLFLDEIGDSSNDIQVKLLRVLETHEIMRVGSSTPLRLNVRVVAATDADLEQLIAAGRFKAPLYHRLGHFNISVPPLRERRADIPSLFMRFLHDAFAETRQSDRWHAVGIWLPAALVASVMRHDWPGNVRQLKSFAQALAISNRGQQAFVLPRELERQLVGPLATGSPVELASPSAARPPDVHHESPRIAASSPVSEADALEALRANHWEVRPAARALGIAPNTLYQLIDRSPHLTRASDLDAETLRDALERFSGDQARAADHLMLSVRALRQRMRELGLGGI